ncbi:hypothetical protein HDU76_005651 [Blyttiomyces sp. JEL0837]|nr:hypothetical protein HDU76_005651 [Blyttiomyces sp. JEL0837]
MQFTIIASSAIAILGAASASSALALEHTNFDTSLMSTFVSNQVSSFVDVSQTCKNDALAFQYDFNSCVPGAIVTNGNAPKVQLSDSQVQCLCAGNTLVDLINGQKDCPMDAGLDSLVYFMETICPNAKKVGTTTVVPAGVDPLNPNKKNSAAKTGVSMVAVAAVALAALAM